MKTLIAAILFGGASIMTAQAQTDRNQTPTQTPGQTQTQPQNPNRANDNNVQTHTDRMATDLKLNTDQQKRLHQYNTTRYQDNQKLNQMTGEDRTRLQKMQSDQYDKNLRGVLDENQYKQYESRRTDYGTQWDSTNEPVRQGMEPAKSGTGTQAPR